MILFYLTYLFDHRRITFNVNFYAKWLIGYVLIYIYSTIELRCKFLEYRNYWRSWTHTIDLNSHTWKDNIEDIIERGTRPLLKNRITPENILTLNKIKWAAGHLGNFKSQAFDDIFIVGPNKGRWRNNWNNKYLYKRPGAVWTTSRGCLNGGILFQLLWAIVVDQ